MNEQQARRPPTDSSRRQALDRTLLLTRDHLTKRVSDETIIESLTTTKIILAANDVNLQTAEAQNSLMTTFLLIARSGAQIFLDAPNTEIAYNAAPFRGGRLIDSLTEIGADILPGNVVSVGRPPGRADLAIVIGDTSWNGKADRILWLSGNAWAGEIAHRRGARWRSTGCPFGALAAAGLAAGEAYKAALMHLRDYAGVVGAFDELFAPSITACVALAPECTPVPVGKFGPIDIVSAGAITNSFLYTLARLPRATAEGRVFDAESSDITNVNRYTLLRLSDCGTRKVEHLERLYLGEIDLSGHPYRYDESTMRQPGAPARMVFVGVDHIPTRWVAQSARPEWLGIGATSHYSSMASQHQRGGGCARCLHPYDEPDDGRIPTVAFVSFWAGLWLASLGVRRADGLPMTMRDQMVYMTSLRSDKAAGVLHMPVAPRADCQLRCPL